MRDEVGRKKCGLTAEDAEIAEVIDDKRMGRDAHPFLCSGIWVGRRMIVAGYCAVYGTMEITCSSAKTHPKR